jgi:trimeric autotransporter adhesin
MEAYETRHTEKSCEATAKRVFGSLASIVLFVSQLSVSALAEERNFDLSSEQATVAASKAGSITVGGTLQADGTVTGGTEMSVAIGQLLTPAQNAALWQSVLGDQHILINNNGVAIGGTAVLNSSWAGNLSSIVVPTGVSVATVGFNESNPLSVSGASSVLGSVYALQNVFGQTGTMNFASNFNIGANGTLSGFLPVTLPGINLAGLFGSQNLAINVLGNFTNNGSVTVPGDLALNVTGTFTNATLPSMAAASLSAQNINIMSGSGNIINSGLMSANNAINISTTSAITDLIVNNTGGTLGALSSINVRDVLYSGAAKIDFTGGDLLSDELHLNAGSGAVSLEVEDLSGLVFVKAGAATIGAATPRLDTGKVDVTGAVVLYNNGDGKLGYLGLGGLNSRIGSLVATASSLVYASSRNTKIDTSSSTGNGGNVFIASGVLAHNNNGAITLSSAKQQGTVNLGLTGIPNFIDENSGFHSILALDTSSSLDGGSGGNVTVMATADGYQFTGLIRMPYDISIETRGTGTGRNGDISILNGGGAIEAGGINTRAGSFGVGGGGDITISTRPLDLSAVSINGATATYSGLTMTGAATGMVTGYGSMSSPSSINFQAFAVDLGLYFGPSQLRAQNITFDTSSGFGIFGFIDTKTLSITTSTKSVSGYTVVSLPGTNAEQISLSVASGTVKISNTGDVTYTALTAGSAELSSTGKITFTDDVTLAQGLKLQAASVTFDPGISVSAAEIVATGLQDQDFSFNNSGNLTTTYEISIKSSAGTNLIVTGDGILSTTNPGAKTTLQAQIAGGVHNSVILSGNTTFTSPSVVEASGNQSVVVQTGATVTALSSLTLNTNFLDIQGTGSINSYTLNSNGAAGTIANSTGSIDLASIANLQFNGSNLTILAAGDIFNSGGSRTIDLSGGSTKNGGNLNLIAGFDFSPAASVATTTPPVLDQYDITASAPSPANISLSNVSIRTDTSGANLRSGSVFAVATGSITLGSIQTKASGAGGTAGHISLMGNGIATGTIESSGATSGNVSLLSGQTALAVPVAISKGSLSLGSFALTGLSGDISIQSILAGNADIVLHTGGTGSILQGAGTTPTTTGQLLMRTGSAGVNLTTAASTVSIHSMGDITLLSPSTTVSLNDVSTPGKINIAAKTISINDGRAIVAGGDVLLSGSDYVYGDYPTSMFGNLPSVNYSKVHLIPKRSLLRRRDSWVGSLAAQRRTSWKMICGRQ